VQVLRAVRQDTFVQSRNGLSGLVFDISPAWLIVSLIDSNRSGLVAAQSGPSRQDPPPGRKMTTFSIGLPVGASRIQNAYGLPSPQRVPVASLSRTICVGVAGAGTDTLARGPQSRSSGAVWP